MSAICAAARVGSTLYKISRREQAFIIFEDLIQKFDAVFHSSIGRRDDNTIGPWKFFKDGNSGTHGHAHGLAHPSSHSLAVIRDKAVR